MPEYKLKRFQSVSAPADVALYLRWLVENIPRSLPGVRGVCFELELELELPPGRPTNQTRPAFATGTARPVRIWLACGARVRQRGS